MLLRHARRLGRRFPPPPALPSHPRRGITLLGHGAGSPPPPPPTATDLLTGALGTDPSSPAAAAPLSLPDRLAAAAALVAATGVPMTTTTWARLTSRAEGAAAVAAAAAAAAPGLTPHARALVLPAAADGAAGSGAGAAGVPSAEAVAAAAEAATAAPSAAAAAAVAAAGMPPNLTIDPRVYKVRSYRGLWTERRKVLRGEAEADARAAAAEGS